MKNNENEWKTNENQWNIYENHESNSNRNRKDNNYNTIFGPLKNDPKMTPFRSFLSYANDSKAHIPVAPPSTWTSYFRNIVVDWRSFFAH